MIGKRIALIQVPNQRLFSVEAACQYLGNIDRKTLYTWTKRGWLQAVDVSGQRHYTLDELDRFIDSRPAWQDNASGRKPASASSKEMHG